MDNCYCCKRAGKLESEGGGAIFCALRILNNSAVPRKSRFAKIVNRSKILVVMYTRVSISVHVCKVLLSYARVWTFPYISRYFPTPGNASLACREVLGTCEYIYIHADACAVHPHVFNKPCNGSTSIHMHTHGYMDRGFVCIHMYPYVSVSVCIRMYSCNLNPNPEP